VDRNPDLSCTSRDGGLSGPGNHQCSHAFIRCFIGCALIIPMIIQTILLYPSGAVWTDDPTNVSRLDPSGAVQVDAEHPSRNRKVVGSNPTSGSKTAGQSTFTVILSLVLLASLIILCV
jgi:hypothetical protein